jgi:hypothetical protein
MVLIQYFHQLPQQAVVVEAGQQEVILEVLVAAIVLIQQALQLEAVLLDKAMLVEFLMVII